MLQKWNDLDKILLEVYYQVLQEDNIDTNGDKIKQLKLMEINLITDFKKGEKFKIVEQGLKNRFGRNHGVDPDGILEFIEIYSENRATGHFKTEIDNIITLKANEVKKIIKKT